MVGDGGIVVVLIGVELVPLALELGTLRGAAAGRPEPWGVAALVGAVDAGGLDGRGGAPLTRRRRPQQLGKTAEGAEGGEGVQSARLCQELSQWYRAGQGGRRGGRGAGGGGGRLGAG